MDSDQADGAGAATEQEPGWHRMLLNELNVAVRAGAPRGKSSSTAGPGSAKARDQGPIKKEEEPQVEGAVWVGMVWRGVVW